MAAYNEQVSAARAWLMALVEVDEARERAKAAGATFQEMIPPDFGPGFEQSDYIDLLLDAAGASPTLNKIVGEVTELVNTVQAFRTATAKAKASRFN